MQQIVRAGVFLGLLILASAAHAQRMPSRVYYADAATASAAAPIVLRMPGAPTAYIEIAPSAQDLANAAASSKSSRPGLQRQRVGSVFVSPEEPTFRTWQSTRDQGSVTHIVVTSRGAYGVRAQLVLPAGMTNGEIRVANRADGAAEALPLSAAQDGLLWTPYTEGDTQVIEIFTRQRAFDAVVGVAQIVHMEQALNADGSAPGQPYASTAAGACTVDVACTTGDAATDLALTHRRLSVGRMLFTSGSGSFVCTGTLLNSNAFPVPYFVTANHCISTSAEAASIVTRWSYYSSTCGANPANPAFTSNNNGMQLVFTNRMVDSTLLKMNSAPPNGSEYAGWNAGLLHAGDPIVSVSNPAGDVMKFALGNLTNATTSGIRDGEIRIQGFPFDMYAISFNRGIIQGGSSGSGLFAMNNGSLELRGILTGTTVDNDPNGMSCTNLNEYALYDRFEAFYPEIKPYFDNVAFPTDDYPNQPNSAATAIALGASVPATISYAGDIDVFKVVLTQAGKLTVGSTGAYDTVGTLLVSDGSCVKDSTGECDDTTSNDDGAGNAGSDNNFRIDNVALQPGTYYIAVGSWDPNGTTPNGYNVYTTFTPNVLPLSKRGGIDLDGNNKSAIIVRSPNGQMQAGRFVTNAFQWSSLAGPGTNYELLAVGDFNGNGKSDLAIREIVSDPIFGNVYVWPDFNSNAQVLLRSVKKAWLVQAVGDLDGDGFGDMTFRFTGDDGIPNDTGVSYVWFTDGSSVTKVRKRGGAPLNWTLLGAADLNGDGAADMAYISPTGDVRILMATPSRTCANLSAGTIPAGYTALGLADFTGNNRGDILIRNTITGAVKILSMDARGLTLPAYGGTPDDPNASCTASSLVIPVTTYSMGTADPTWTYYATGDFNGDGIFDVIWQRPDGTLTVWLLGTNGAPAVIVNSAGTAPAGFTVFQVGGGGGTGVAQAASTKAEGIYAGTTSTGYSFDSIFLEDDTFWTVYGVPTASGGLTVYGFDQGSGTSANGSYTALNAKDFFHTGVVSTGNLTATYVPNQSISGSFGTGTFSGTKPVTTAYSYGNPAQLVDIVGTWTGNLLDSSVASITIAANGAFTGTNVGCSFSGTITPRASGKSVFNVSLTFGGAPCALSGQTVGGIGLWVNVGASSKQLVIPVVNTGKTLGTIFFAVR